MYWWNLLPPFSGYKIFLYLKLEAAGFLRTLTTRYETTQDISQKMVIIPVLTFLPLSIYQIFVFLPMDSKVSPLRKT